jgi:betaine reductase
LFKKKVFFTFLNKLETMSVAAAIGVSSLASLSLVFSGLPSHRQVACEAIEHTFLNTHFKIERMIRMDLTSKKVFVLGERDGVPAPAIEECVKAVGAEVIYKDTQCFV